MPLLEIPFQPGDSIDNDQLCEIFKCSPQGGMRRSKATNTLIIVSNHVASIYDDKWIGDVLHYTGMGSEGDQSLSFMQNKTLTESDENEVDVHLFEVFRVKEYTYMGRVRLAGEPYREVQPDANMRDRNVWMFPLRLVDETGPTVGKDLLDDLHETRAHEAKRLSDEELEERARRSGQKRADLRTVQTTQYDRNDYVSELAQRSAGGMCQLCRQPAPFRRKDGTPFLETHHIVWLSQGGEDIIENTVALCPNCHRKMHILNDVSDLKVLQGIHNT